VSNENVPTPAGSGQPAEPTGQPAPVDVLLSQLPAIAETLTRAQIEQRGRATA
jgi:hypothetical protein